MTSSGVKRISCRAVGGSFKSRGVRDQKFRSPSIYGISHRPECPEFMQKSGLKTDVARIAEKLLVFEIHQAFAGRVALSRRNHNKTHRKTIKFNEN